MADPIRDLADRLAKVERQLHALATAPRAPHTSVRDGFMRFQPPGDAENPKLYLGGTDATDVALIVNDADGGDGEVYIGTAGGRVRVSFFNSDTTGLVLRLDDGHLVAPQATCAWQRYAGASIDALGMSTTNSATYVDLWHSILPLGTNEIATVIDVVPDGGVTADVRIVGSVIGGVHTGTPAASQEINADIGITTTVVIQDVPWTVPESIWTSPADVAGALLWMTIQARVTAGSPSLVHVAPRLPAWVS